MNENVDYPSTRLLLTHKICSSYDMISIYKIVVVSMVCFINKTINLIMLTLISLWKNLFTLLFSLSNSITQDYFLFIKIETITFLFHFQFSIHPTTCRRVPQRGLKLPCFETQEFKSRASTISSPRLFIFNTIKFFSLAPQLHP